MPLAHDASSYVFQGIWTNWGKGMILGKTLTLSTPNSIILVSVLAIFVQVTGSQLWRVLQIALHQSRATQKPRDGLYHQQQAVLRNNPSDFGTVWQLMRVGWAWRHHKTSKSLRRSFALVTWALLHFVLFAVAGIFSSTLINAGDDVLSRSPSCGTFNNTYFNSLGSSATIGMVNHLLIEYDTYFQTRYQQSQEYAQACYNASELLVNCGSSVQSHLTWNTTMHSSCPFVSPVCLESAPVITYDTGLLSSHGDLGLNAYERDRIWYRRKTTCTVLDDRSFISDWKSIPGSAGAPSKKVVDAYYGSNPLADRNATYSFSEWDQYYSFDQYSDTNPYQIDVQNAIPNDPQLYFSTFLPIPQLAQTDADITLVFLSFSKRYESAVNDPWFSAHEAGMYPVRYQDTINGTVYRRDIPVTTVGCTEQHQFCVRRPSSSATSQNKCTPMLGYAQIDGNFDGIQALNLTARQASTYQRVLQSAIDSVLFGILWGLAQRDPPLLARRKIQGFVGMGLPDDQWQQETEYWHSIAMAHLQRSVIAYGTGEFAADTEYINVSTVPSDKWLCQNLLIRGTSYQSFNLFALVSIFLLGLLIVLAGLKIEDLVAWSQQKLGSGLTKREMWRNNELLEMQSMLNEHEGFGVWSHGSNGVPVSGPGQVMGTVQRRQRRQHNESLNTPVSSSDTTKKESWTMLQSLRGSLTPPKNVEYNCLQNSEYPERMSYPPPGWGVLPLQQHNIPNTPC